MSNLVIVAIPDENERVWQISSEKVPHLTLLYLGDADQVSNLDKILEFVQHAASTTLQRFYLPVDRRDKLGSDDADVLFFRRASYDMKAVREFRSSLLKDDNIRTAYDSAEQIEGPWLPHLTLGFPATPAKQDDTDNPQGFYDVKFDKIAVWTDDYDGPAFLLKDYWDEMEAMENAPGDFSMSDTTKSGADAVASLLEHHGVKGMKWGVHKDRQGRDRWDPAGHSTGVDVAKALLLNGTGVGTALAMPANVRLGKRVIADRKASRAERGDEKWRKDLNSVKKGVEVHNKSSEEVNRKLPGFNADKRWHDSDGREIDLNKNAAKMEEYNRAFERELLNPAYANAAAAIHGTSPSGRYRFEVHDATTGLMKVTDTTRIRHAATDDDDFDYEISFDILRDVSGHINGFAWPRSTAAHGAEFVDTLTHHGVRGMKWGQRRANRVAESLKVGSSPGAMRDAKRDAKWLRSTSPKNPLDPLSRSRSESNIAKTATRSLKPETKAINKKPEYNGKEAKRELKRWDSPLRKRYDQEHTDAFIKHMKLAAEKHLDPSAKNITSPSGNWKQDLKINKNGDWVVGISRTKRNVEHAADDPFSLTLTVHPVRDEDGHIVDFEIAGDDVEHSTVRMTATDGEIFVDTLVHHGVRGMKWGQRRAAPSPVSPHAESKVPHGDKRKTRIQVEGGENHPAHEDAIRVAKAKAKLAKSGPAALSNNELRDVASRVQLEQQVRQLVTPAGKKFVNNLLRSQGNQAANLVIGKQVRRKLAVA